MEEKKIIVKYLTTPVGELILGAWENQLCLCDWRYRKMRGSIDKRIQEGLNATFKEGDDPVFPLVEKQISEYFEGDRSSFDIPLILIGSTFQKMVWTSLQEIPYGKTESYVTLSKKLGDVKAIRAVASANGANAISIIVPCHRIIGSKGELVGYAGGLQVKKKLLKLENRGQRPEQLEMF
ncbi:methylated-DNA--[protein]-cysteine S-methyltransferase [Bacteroidota bacterium]